jgi:hypothetical protein
MPTERDGHLEVTNPKLLFFMKLPKPIRSIEPGLYWIKLNG